MGRHKAVALVCDMTSSSTWEFLRYFAKEKTEENSTNAIPFVALTSEEDVPKAMELGATMAICRPLEADVLLRDLRSITRHEQPKKLLLVDDNDLSLYILRELLDRPWLHLIEAHNGREALEMIDRERPDGVILDLVMPVMGGFEVLEQLRSKEPTRKLPVIVYTSKTLSEDEKQRLEQLSAGLIPKSAITRTLSPESLLSSLARLDIAGPDNR